MNDSCFDVMILGGGLVGAGMALALCRQGKRVLLFEQRPPETDLAILAQSWDARIYAISPANQAFLADLGVWPQERTQTVTLMDVRGDAGGHLVFDAVQAGVPWLTQIVENRYLRAHIWQALTQAGVSICTAQAVGVHTDALAAQITTADGRTYSARLLIGADGAQSWLRRELGIEVVATPYAHHAVVANFITEKPHQSCAYQWFKQQQVLAYLPLPGNRISMVWSTPDPQSLTQCTPKELAAKVAKQGEYVLGELQTDTPAFAFELILRKPRQIIAPRIALIGDAAHTIHPLAGQGVNLGFGDVQCLTKLLETAADTGNYSLLMRYREQRLWPVRTMQQSCHALFRLFGNWQMPCASWARNTGLNAVNHLPLLKQQMIYHAMGLSPGR